MELRSRHFYVATCSSSVTRGELVDLTRGLQRYDDSYPFVNDSNFFNHFFFVDCLSVVVICLAICLVINNIIVNKMLLCEDNIHWLVCWQHYIQWTMLNADLLLASAPAIILSGSINDLVVDFISEVFASTKWNKCIINFFFFPLQLYFFSVSTG